MPSGVLTVTFTLVPAVPAGAVAVSWVGDPTSTAVAGRDPKLTVVPGAKLAPCTVTEVPPDAGPDEGESELTEGPARVTSATEVPQDFELLVPYSPASQMSDELEGSTTAPE